MSCRDSRRSCRFLSYFTLSLSVSLHFFLFFYSYSARRGYFVFENKFHRGLKKVSDDFTGTSVENKTPVGSRTALYEDALWVLSTLSNNNSDQQFVVGVHI